LVEIVTYGAYAQLQEKLTELGFQIDTEAKVTCRYKYQGLIVDIMPLDKNVLGFENKWCKEGFHHLQVYKIDDRVSINILPLAYFLASKLEAFNRRGNN